MTDITSRQELHPFQGSLFPEAERVVHPDAETVISPEQAAIFIEQGLAVLGRYAQLTERQRDLDHPQRVLGLFGDYCPDELNPGLEVAILLHDVYDRGISDNLSKASPAIQALAPFLAWSDKHKFELEDYVFPVLQSMQNIEEKAEAYRTRFKIEGRDDVSRALATAIRDGKDVGLQPSDWLVEFDGIFEADELLELLRQENVEAAIANAVELLEKLQYPPNNQAALLRDVHEALFFYFPLLEILGKDELATALRSKALEIKLEKGGRTDLLDRAREMLEGGEEVLATVREQLFPEYTIMHNKGSSEYYNSMGILTTPEHPNSPGAIIQTRLKSVGSLAYNLLKYERQGRPLERIPDVLGLNILGSTWQGAVAWLLFLHKKAKSLGEATNHIELSDSPSNGDGVHVVFDRLESNVAAKLFEDDIRRDIGESHMKVQDRGTGFEALKLYLRVRKSDGSYMSVELQLLPQNVHLNNRIGLGAHFFRKVDASVEDRERQVGFLSAIRERLSRLSHGTTRALAVNGQSVESGINGWLKIAQRVEAFLGLGFLASTQEVD